MIFKGKDGDVLRDSTFFPSMKKLNLCCFHFHMYSFPFITFFKKSIILFFINITIFKKKSKTKNKL